jgi:hypothetical protein
MFINQQIITKPNLIENQIKGFYLEMLKNCHKIREINYNIIYNLFLFFLFILTICILLIYKYKGKLNTEEINQKEEEKKYYILSKIKNYNDTKLKEQQSLITGLPYF